MTRHAIALAAALALAFGAASAQADTVVTNTYDASSTASDIDKSCTDLEANSSGTVSGKCNKTSEGDVVTNDTSVDVSGKIKCGMSQGSDTAITWGSTQNTYWKPASWEVELNSTGTKYLISAECTSLYGVKANASSLELGDSNNGIDNSSGDFSF